jgi:hypothetical protein
MRLELDAIWPFITVMTLACVVTGSVAADNQPPAGQMCPEGAYVIGFDSESNIVCSGMAGAVPSKTPGTAQDADRGHDRAEPAGNELAGDEQAPGENTAGPVISDIKPPWVVFGARETTIRIIGSGFTADTIVKFQGAAYTPTVNAAGTELRVTIGTRELPMGRYPITVSNGTGMETTRPRSLEVF